MTFKYFITRVVFMFTLLLMVITAMYFTLSWAQWRVWNRGETIGSFLSRTWPMYIDYMKNIFLSWDWGTNRDGEDAWKILLDHAPQTLWFNFMAFAIYVPLSIVFGVIAGANRNTMIDRIISLPMHVFSSVPNFIWFFFFILFFGYTVYWFPIIRPPEEAGFFESFKFWVLPITALSLLPLSKFTLLIRSEFAETIAADYNLLLRAKGLNRWQRLRKHQLKHCIAPVLPEITPTFIFVFASSFLLEHMGYLYGAAALLMDSLIRRMPAAHVMIDLNVAVLVIAFYVSVGLLVALAIDMLYYVSDPRIRIGSDKRQTETG